jgi:hypothetical protein
MVTDDLDRKSKRILEAIHEHGGEAQTSEIKDYTGIEKNGVIHYRLDNILVPEGLVETRKIDEGGGSLGVKVSELTERGLEVIGGVLDDRDGPTLAEEMRALRATVDDMVDLVEGFDGRVDYVEDRLEEVNERFQSVAQIEEAAREAEAALDRAEAAAAEADRLREENRELRNTITEVEGMVEFLADVDLVRGDPHGDGLRKGPALERIEEERNPALLTRLEELDEELIENLVWLSEEGMIDHLVDRQEELNRVEELRGRDDTHRAYDEEEVLDVLHEKGGEATIEELAEALYTTEDVVGQLVFSLEQEVYDVEKETRHDFDEDGEGGGRREVVVDRRVAEGSE